MNRLGLLVLLLPLLVGPLPARAQQVQPHQERLPGPVTLIVTCGPGDCSHLDWWRQRSGDDWVPYARAANTFEIGDTLVQGDIVRYKVRAYKSNWTCDEVGCRETEPYEWGEFGDVASDWLIAVAQPGACGKPEVK